MRYLLPIVVMMSIFTSCDQKPENGLSGYSDLRIGETLAKKSLAQHATDTFRLELRKNSFVYGNANQLTVDLVVKIFDPGHKEVATFDGPARGPENFTFTADKDGIYTIAVSPFQEQSGEYSITLAGAEAFAEDPAQRIDQLVKATLGVDEKIPGVAIAVEKDGKIILSKGYGLADIEQHAKVNSATTIFHIASVSKQFTAFAIATLADQGKINLDDDIRKYLPEIHDFGTPITIRQLAHHTSGLRDQWSLLTMAGWRMDDVITMPQIMRLVSRQTELNFRPGDEHVYCNTGFTLMGEIVKRVTHQTFPEWCKENIFDPLEMKNTLFYDDHQRIVENRAYSYYRGDDGYKKSVLSYANAGATSLFTTVEDLSLWAHNFETVKVGNPNIMKIMESRYVLNNGDTIDYAFGQEVGKYKGLKTWSHSGGDAGYRTYLLRFLDQHVSISVFSNYAAFPVADLTYQAADLYLKNDFTEEKKPGNNSNNNNDFVPFDVNTMKLNEYEGEYYSPELETTYRFELRNDTLISHHQRHDDAILRATKADGFTLNILGDLSFYREKGKVAGFRASNGRVRNLKFIRQEQASVRHSGL